MLSLEAGVLRLQQLTKARSLVVAYSGGMDSQVLLHWLVQLSAWDVSYQVRAVHVNHQWHPDSDAWERHCEQTAAAWGVGFSSRRVTLQSVSQEGLEAQARRLRYEQLIQSIDPEEVLLTAHHEDDQAETLLLQCLRGAGVKGLSAMPMKRDWDGATLLRPFLDQPQSVLRQYANTHALAWVEDSSNDDETIDRNFIRHQVLPLLTSRWPKAVPALARSAQHCASASQVIDLLAASDASTCVMRRDQLNISAWAQLPAERGRQVLRYWLASYGCTLPSTQQLQLIIGEVIQARDDAQPCYHWGQWTCRRYQGVLYVMSPLPAHDAAEVIPWDLQADLDLGLGIGLLSVQSPELTALVARLGVTQLTVRFRQGGERIRLAGHECTHAVKQLFQQWHVPPWERDRVPLLFNGEQCVMIWGYGSV